VETETDATVITASLCDPARFGAIFDRHATVLHRYLVRRLGPDDAEAMVGDIFLIAFQRRDTYDVARPDARPWLYGIASNLLARKRRTEARRLSAVARLAAQRLPATDFTDVVAGGLDAEQLWPTVVDAVTSLPALERDALLLHVWEGLSYDDVADALSIPVGTVRSRLNRARRRLRELAPAPAGLTDRQDPGRIRS
jgi:RNA polymerase sigma-70 factor (ECF subfamily)